MWPSIVFQPLQLAKSMIGAKVWEKVEPLDKSEKVNYKEAASKMEVPRSKLAETFEIDTDVLKEAAK